MGNNMLFIGTALLVIGFVLFLIGMRKRGKEFLKVLG